MSSLQSLGQGGFHVTLSHMGCKCRAGTQYRWCWNGSRGQGAECRDLSKVAQGVPGALASPTRVFSTAPFCTGEPGAR